MSGLMKRASKEARAHYAHRRRQRLWPYAPKIKGWPIVFDSLNESQQQWVRRLASTLRAEDLFSVNTNISDATRSVWSTLQDIRRAEQCQKAANTSS